MTCKNCQSEIQEGSAFCTFCGTPVEDTDKSSPITPATRPMKWFKFLIYFALFANAVINLYNCFAYLSGVPYGENASLVYGFLPSLKTIDVVMAIVSVGLAVYAIVTRILLAKYKKLGVKMFLGIPVLNIITQVVYYMSVSSVISSLMSASEGIDFTTITVNVVSNIVLFVLNLIYFKKREDMFK